MAQAALFASRAFGAVMRFPAVQTMLKTWAGFLSTGSSLGSPRNDHTMRAVAEVEDGAGTHVGARLETPEAYTFTAMTAAEILRRVTNGDFEPGFQTPARLFGADFVLGFPGVVREDFEEGHDAKA